MLTISSEQTAEKLLQTYYNLKNQGVSLDREGENIFEDEKLAESFCNFLKKYFKMQVGCRVTGTQINSKQKG